MGLPDLEKTLQLSCDDFLRPIMMYVFLLYQSVVYLEIVFKNIGQSLQLATLFL
jgi:hypothetical protein